MKKLIVAVLLLSPACLTQPSYVKTVEFNSKAGDSEIIVKIVNDNEVLLIKDNVTGTRCYGLTNKNYHVAGYVMQCLPRQFFY